MVGQVASSGDCSAALEAPANNRRIKANSQQKRARIFSSILSPTDFLETAAGTRSRQTNSVQLFGPWPEARRRNLPGILLVGEFLDSRGNIRTFSNQDEDKIFRGKMFGDDLLSDFRGDGVDARVEQIHFVIGQAVELIGSDQVRQLRGGFHGRGKLALHVAFCGGELFSGQTIGVKFFERLESEVQSFFGGFVAGKTVNSKRAGQFSGAEEGP